MFLSKKQSHQKVESQLNQNMMYQTKQEKRVKSRSSSINSHDVNKPESYKEYIHEKQNH